MGLRRNRWFVGEAIHKHTVEPEEPILRGQVVFKSNSIWTQTIHDRVAFKRVISVTICKEYASKKMFYLMTG